MVWSLEPFKYLRHVLEKIAAAETVEDIEALIPWNVEIKVDFRALAFQTCFGHRTGALLRFSTWYAAPDYGPKAIVQQAVGQILYRAGFSKGSLTLKHYCPGMWNYRSILGRLHLMTVMKLHHMIRVPLMSMANNIYFRWAENCLFTPVIDIRYLSIFKLTPYSRAASSS